jgi:hypothetical protein
MEELLKMAGPFENILRVMLKHYKYFNVNIIIKLTKSVGFPDFFLKELEIVDN